MELVPEWTHTCNLEYRQLLRYENQFNNPTFSDVTLLLPDGSRLHCHRMVLASWSPVFERMFTARMSESNQKEVTFQDVEGAALQSLVKYMYSGKLTCAGAPATLALWKVADVYDVVCVQDACKQQLEKQLEDSVCDAYKAAQLFLEARKQGLLDWSVKFLDACLCHPYQHSDIWNQFSLEEMQMLVQVQIAVWSEYDVLNVLMGWVEAQPHERMQHLDCLLQHIDFAVFTLSQLAGASKAYTDKCKDSKLPALLLDGFTTVAGQQPEAYQINLAAELLVHHRYNFCGRLERWVPVFSGKYRIVVAGAKATDTADGTGGRGGIVSGTFSLKAGDSIALLAGAMPDKVETSVHMSGGGGASFVAKLGEDGEWYPLVVAGGGGGANHKVNGGDAVTSSVAVDTAGKAGSRGASSSKSYGGGDGGGWVTGGQGVSERAGKGGPSLISYITGNPLPIPGAGYGGGGAGGIGTVFTGAGGGGGYTGGKGGEVAEGGSCYAHASAEDVVMNVDNTGHGYVLISSLVRKRKVAEAATGGNSIDDNAARGVQDGDGNVVTGDANSDAGEQAQAKGAESRVADADTGLEGNESCKKRKTMDDVQSS